MPNPPKTCPNDGMVSRKNISGREWVDGVASAQGGRKPDRD